MTTHQSTTSSEDNAVCAHGIAASAISAWHDGELVPAEATRIAAHVANCPASRAHLDDYATLIAALRAQPVPYDAARLWADVRAGESQARGGPRRFRATGQRMLSPSNRYLAGLAAAAAAVLIVAGFATIFTHLPGRGPHQPRPTSTATQGPRARCN